MWHNVVDNLKWMGEVVDFRGEGGEAATDLKSTEAAGTDEGRS